MEEIKVNEYVRLDNGSIGKVIAIEKGSIMLDIASNRWVGICCIVKHSPNIIDLIEEGDYVNGELITQADYDLFINSDFKQEYAKHIETILTKELYEANCYKVKE